MKKGKKDEYEEKKGYFLFLFKKMSNTFEDLIVWKESENLTLKIYKYFSNLKDFGFKDQIQRASISIMNNIAEGYEKKTIKDKQKFFRVSKGSCGEVRSMLHIAVKLGYINSEEYEIMKKQCFGISKILYNLIKSLK